MRLRYLHLPRCGPLSNTAVVFGREELIAKALKLPRQGSLNFVVGVNGTGKSSLLRAVYRIFRALKNNQLPLMPFTLAWDISPADEVVTAFLHVPENKSEKPYFIALKRVSPDANKAQWFQLTQELKGDMGTIRLDQAIDRGDTVLGSYLQAHLPKRLIAYTSGTDAPWVQLDHPVFSPKDELAEQYQTQDERPPGWTMDQEWKDKQIASVADILSRFAVTPGELRLGAFPGMQNLPNEELRAQLEPYMEPLNALRRKVFSNSMARTEQADDFYFRLRPGHLRYAGITMALWQAAKELSPCADEGQLEKLRQRLLQEPKGGENSRDARRVLNELDWFWPTHLSVTYRDAKDLVRPRQHQELLCLVALADEVITQPRGRQRAVIALGPSNGISLSERLKEVFPLGIPSKTLDFIAERVDGCKTGAEAVLRLFSADTNLDSTPLDLFSRLRDWEQTGLLEEISLTMKRIHRPESADDEPDNIVVSYDQLSDGEQMLLGRMGLLFLLRGQNGSLLLLDEPETHFNDVWKREIVEMIDHGLLNSTQANVLVATHTSIALTDAFAAEVTVLDRQLREDSANTVALPLFGADPGRVLLHVFGAQDMIGVSAARILRAIISKPDWTKSEIEALRSLIEVAGSGWPRAKLMEILEKLENQNAAPSS